MRVAFCTKTGRSRTDCDRCSIRRRRVYSEVEQRQVALAIRHLQLCSDGPDVARSQRWLRPDKLALFQVERRGAIG